MTDAFNQASLKDLTLEELQALFRNEQNKLVQSQPASHRKARSALKPGRFGCRDRSAAVTWRPLHIVRNPITKGLVIGGIIT